MKHVNPIQIADKERKLLWPKLRDECPDLTLSIGTTFRAPIPPLSPEAKVLPRTGGLAYGKSLYKTPVDHIQGPSDAEKAWTTYMSVLQPPRDYHDRYIRINPPLSEEPPDLDDVDRMQYIQELVRGQLRRDDRIHQVALQLVATCFYFEKLAPVEKSSENDYLCKGWTPNCCNGKHAKSNYQDKFCADYRQRADILASLAGF